MASNSKVSPPPSTVDDVNNPAWKTWFSTMQESNDLNKHLSHIEVSADTTADKEAIIIVTSNVTVTLPSADVSEDISYYIKRVTAAGTVTIASSDNIDGAASITLDDNYDAAQLFCDGTTWHLVVEPALSPDDLDNVTNDAQVKKISSSTDNAVMRWDGTTGDLPQDSGVLIDDDDNLSGHGSNINAQTGTTYTLVGTDNGKVVTLDNASAITLTLPQTSTETIAEGFQCVIINKGAGQVTVAKEGSDTILSANSLLSLSVQGSSGAILKTTAGSPNAWALFGDLV